MTLLLMCLGALAVGLIGLAVRAHRLARELTALKAVMADRAVDDRMDAPSEVLRARERDLAEAQYVARLGSWTWDVVRDRATWSLELYRLFEQDPLRYEPNFESYLRLVHPEDREEVRRRFSEARPEEPRFTCDHRFVRSDGEVRAFHLRAEAFFGEDGQALRMVGTAQDVTENRRVLGEFARQSRELQARNDQVEAELIEERALLERIVQHVPAAIAYIDRNLICRWLNPEAGRSLGLPKSRLVRLPVSMRWPDELVTGIREVLAENRPIHGGPIRYKVERSGETLVTHWEFSLIPCADPEASVAGVLAFGREISERLERERLQEAQIAMLRESEAIQEQIVDTLSHAFRSPLTVIMGTGLLFRGGALGPISEKQGAYLEKLIRQSQQLLRLSNNVLEMNMQRAGRLTLQRESFDLHPLVAEVFGELGSLAAQRKQTLREHLPEDPVRLRADRQRVALILTNLVENALSFSAVDAAVTLRAAREGAWVRVAMASNASCLTPEELSGVFLPFTGSGAQNGLRLGLCLSKALVEAHGGACGVERLSDAEVEFWFTLPAAAA